MKVKILKKMTLNERIDYLQPDIYRIFNDFTNEHVRVYNAFAKQYISNMFPKDKVKKWTNDGYVIIAQTGTGKSTWVTRTIAEMLLEDRATGLLITPRVALTMQYKRELAKLYCPELLEELTEQGIHKQHEYGPFDVYSLQEFLSAAKVRAIKSKRYEFVILDEVHAFVGDAAFNPFTEKIFRLLLQEAGRQAKRVYLTATPEIILDEIAQVEEEITPEFIPRYDSLGWPKPNIRLTIFRFARDYGYVQPIFFQAEEEILGKMESLSGEKRGLIFVRSVKQGLEWQAKLGDQRAVFMNAQNKRTEREDEFNELLRYQKIDKQFLIVTRFMDVGVNVHDLQLKVVILFHAFPEDVVQMLGRKRVAGNEVVQLYIEIPSIGALKQEVGKLENAEAEIGRNRELLKNRVIMGISELPHPFYMQMTGDKCCLGCNGFFERWIFYHKRFLISCLKGADNENTFVKNFVRNLLLHLPGCKKPFFLDRPEVSDENVCEEVSKILKPLLGKELNREEMGKLSDQLLRIFGERRRSDQQGQIAIKKLNNGLKKYGLTYAVSNKSKEKKRGIWMIEEGISA